MANSNRDQLKTEMKEVAKLVDINKDACEFYSKAKEKVEDKELRAKFLELCSLHAGVVDKLQAEIIARGASPEDVKASETVVGKANRYFGELLAAITPQADGQLISRLEEAEDRCLHSMEDAVNNQEISSELKTALLHQHDELKKSHDYMRMLKNRAA